MVAKIRNHTKQPIAVGFGISSPEQAREIGDLADAVVVGSAIVRRIGEVGDAPELLPEVRELVGALVQPLKGETNGH